MAKSRIDKLIDQAEQTNAQIRALTALVLTANGLSQALPLPPQVKPLIPLVPEIQEKQAELYFNTLRGFASAVQNPAAQQLVGDVGRIGLDSVNLLPVGPTPTAAAQPKKRSTAQKKNDKMQSEAFKTANSKLRTSKGALRKGVTQADVARRAQSELRRMKKSGSKGPSGRKRGRSKRATRSGGGRR